jgi:hypothetical protein
VLAVICELGCISRFPANREICRDSEQFRCRSGHFAGKTGVISVTWRVVAVEREQGIFYQEQGKICYQDSGRIRQPCPLPARQRHHSPVSVVTPPLPTRSKYRVIITMLPLARTSLTSILPEPLTDHEVMRDLAPSSPSSAISFPWVPPGLARPIPPLPTPETVNPLQSACSSSADGAAARTARRSPELLAGAVDARGGDPAIPLTLRGGHWATRKCLRG